MRIGRYFILILQKTNNKFFLSFLVNLFENSQSKGIYFFKFNF